MVALVAAAAARKRRESEEGLVERERTSAWVTRFIGACMHTHLDYDQVPLFLKCTLALYLSTVGCPFGFIRRSTSKRETRLLHPQIPFIIPSLIGTFQRERVEVNTMSFCSSLSSPQSISLFSKPFHGDKPVSVSLSSRIRASADVPDFLSADWLESRRKRPFGPRLNFSAEEAVQYQLDALKYNDQPRQDYGIEVMYRFAGFDPFERSTYFGPFFDLGQFERFRRIFHHSSYRVLLCHRERKILSSLWVKENRFKQRVWIRGTRPEEEEIFQFTMFQRVGGSWDGYWLTESLLHDGDSFSGGMAY